MNLQGILTKVQRDMGMSLVESDHCVSLLINGKERAGWNSNTVTFAAIQLEAYNQEQWLKSGVTYGKNI